MIKYPKEEEKEFYFIDDPDEEKITFENYRKNVEGDYGYFEGQEEDCSECDKDCKSKILADLPTNDSNSFIFEQVEVEQEAKKYLTRLGLLDRIDDNEIFAVDDSDQQFSSKAKDDFDLYWWSPDLRIYQNDDQFGKGLLFDDFCCGRNVDELTEREKELIEEGLPLLRLDEEEFETFHDINISESNQHLSQEKTTLERSKEGTVKDTEEEEVIDTCTVQQQTRKKSTEFNHLLERKTFRMMRKYYKNTFEQFAIPFNYKNNVKTMDPHEMDNLVGNYMREEFDFLLGMLAANEMHLMLTCLKRIILSDRFNKWERVTYGVDFTTSRNLFNKYSTKALNEFISIPPNSILLVHFYLKQGKKLSFCQNDVDKHKLERQMQWLVKEAFGFLPPQFVEVYSHQMWQIINFLN